MSAAAVGRSVASRPGWPVAVQLAHREGRRMIRHPFMWVGAILSLALFGLFTWHSAPVLHRDDTFAAGALLPLAATTLIVANLAAARAARNSTEELYETTSTTTAVRTAGHLLSLAYAAGLAGGVVAVMSVYEMLDSPVGTPDVAEVGTGFLSVVLFGAAGVALARWRPHPALGPVAVVVAVALQILLIQPVIDLDSTNGVVATRGQWFAPWVPLSLTGEVPPELVVRPAGWHALYLAGLVTVVAGIALARSGRGARLLPLFAVGAAGIVLGGAGQVAPASAAQRAELGDLLTHPEDHQVCEQRRGVTYCAFPAYAPWIDRWAAAIEGALEHIPPGARPEGIVVRQRFGRYFEGPIDVPEETLLEVARDRRHAAPDRAPGITLWTEAEWGRGKTEGGYAFGLSLAVAMQALDFPSSRADMRLTPDEIARWEETVLPTIDRRFHERSKRTLRREGRLYSCHTAHQARALAAMWVAAQATPATRAAAIQAASENPYGLTIYEVDGRRVAAYLGSFLPLYPEIPPPMWDRVTFSGEEFHYAVRLLERPDEEVAALFARHWEEMTDPTTMTEPFLDELDLAPHPTLEEQIAQLPGDVELEEGRGMWRPDAYHSQTIPCF